MSTQYVGDNCLVYALTCGRLEVGKCFKKLLPVYSTPSTYSRRHHILNNTATQVSTFVSRPINSTYLQWDDVTPPSSLRRSSRIVNNDRIVFGSSQLTFRVKWCMESTGTPSTGKLTVVVPEGRTNRAHEPWDNKGNRIQLSCGRGSFTLPGQYGALLIHTSPESKNIKLTFRVKSYFKPPDKYGPGEFGVKACDGEKVLAYTNTLSDQLVTRIPSATLATLSRLVNDEFKSRTYFTGPELGETKTTLVPVPGSEFSITCQSRYPCHETLGPDCNVQKGFIRGYYLYNAIGTDNSSVDPFTNQSYMCSNLWGSSYALLDDITVPPGVVLPTWYQNFQLKDGQYYRMELKVESGGINNGKDSYGQGISWSESSAFVSNPPTFGGSTNLLTNNSGCTGDGEYFAISLFEESTQFVNPVKYYQPGSNPSDPGKDGDGVTVYMVPDGDVNVSTVAPSFHTPVSTGLPYSYVIKGTKSSFCFQLDSCVSKFASATGPYYSPLSQIKLKVTLTELETVPV